MGRKYISTAPVQFSVHEINTIYLRRNFCMIILSCSTLRPSGTEVSSWTLRGIFSVRPSVRWNFTQMPTVMWLSNLQPKRGRCHVTRGASISCLGSCDITLWSQRAQADQMKTRSWNTELIWKWLLSVKRKINQFYNICRKLSNAWQPRVWWFEYGVPKTPCKHCITRAEVQ